MTPELQQMTSAPSNIALIKYMGKLDHQKNRPTNSSLSWTLNNLRSYVRLIPTEGGQDLWRPLRAEGLYEAKLGESGQRRYLAHLQNIKALFNRKENYIVESANDFPSDCGLASSASSFAALTIAAVELFESLGSGRSPLSLTEKAQLSAQGSGSSCRSFFGPWTIWYPDGVRPLEFSMEQLLHQCVVIDKNPKKVSSSEAHKRVATSKTFVGRPERAEKRLSNLILALKQNDWPQIYKISWDEFIDMHELFENCEPSFSYMTDSSREILRKLENLWNETGDGPVVTMDAGPNIHLLYRADQAELVNVVKSKLLGSYEVI